MSPSHELLQKHVPAWKKLGLKLKFAKEEPEDTQQSKNGTIDHKKRKSTAEEEGVVDDVPIERPAKKVKKSRPRAEHGEVVNGNGSSYEPGDDDRTMKRIRKSTHSTDESAQAVNGSNKSLIEPTNAENPSKKPKELKVKAGGSTISPSGKIRGIYTQGSSSPPVLRTIPASKQKSVSFTPDTKSKDGDSVKSLYKTWIEKQMATDPSFDPLTISPALRSIVPSIVASPSHPTVTSASTSTLQPSSKKPTKPPKRSKTRLPKTSSGPSPSRFDPVLTYLTIHHTSPQTWKFSKPQQNQILKHLFSLAHIPSSYDPALFSYIGGLKGTFPRSRVRKEALAVLEDDEKWLASESSATEKMENETVAQCNARRRHDYEAAVVRIKDRLREQEDEREERDWELLGEKEEWEERARKRRRAEIVLWSVGKEEEALEDDSVALSQHDTLRGKPGRPVSSGMAQLAQAARDPGPAPRLGRGVGMGMGGVEVIDAGGIAKGSKGKKVVFGDDGAAQADGTNMVKGHGGANGTGQASGANGDHGIKMSNAGNGANGQKPKRKRRQRRRTGVPDDDDSSSESSSSSSSEESEEGEKEQEKKPKRIGSKRSSDDETSNPGSSSGTSSGGDSDSD